MRPVIFIICTFHRDFMRYKRKLSIAYPSLHDVCDIQYVSSMDDLRGRWTCAVCFVEGYIAINRPEREKQEKYVVKRFLNEMQIPEFRFVDEYDNMNIVEFQKFCERLNLLLKMSNAINNERKVFN